MKTILLIALAVGIVGYLVYRHTQKDLHEFDQIAEDDINSMTEELFEEITAVEFQKNFKMKKHHLELVEGDSVQGVSIMNYELFKKICTTDEFINDYMNSMHTALRIKKKKIRELTNDMLKVDKKDFIDNMGPDVTSIINGLKKALVKRKKEISREFAIAAINSVISDPDRGLESLTGRADVKDFICLQLYAFSKNPTIFLENFQNIALYGSSGIGKTKVAKVISHAYSKSGILLRDNTGIITKRELTTAYVNESGRRVYKIFMENLESVIFLDEAYDITPPPSIAGNVDHGHEAITEIVNFLDKRIGMSILIAAGYEKQMETRFMNANEGMARRFPHIMRLSNYSSEELTQILMYFLVRNCKSIRFSEKHGDTCYTLVKYVYDTYPDVFDKQAADMQSLAECISTCIYGSVNVDWNTQYKSLLTYGMNKFLSRKGLTLIESV